MGDWREEDNERLFLLTKSQNPNILPSSTSQENHFPANPLSGNRLFQNPRILQNHQNPFTENIYFQNPFDLPGGFFGQYPMNPPEQSLEASLRLLSLSTSPPPRSQFLPSPPAALGNSGGGGFFPSSYEQKLQMPTIHHVHCLERRRIQSAVRGQMGGDYMSNNNFGLFNPQYSNSSSRNYLPPDESAASSSSYGSSEASTSRFRKGNQQDYNFQRSHNAHRHHECKYCNKFEGAMMPEETEMDRLYKSMLYDNCECKILKICEESDQEKITEILLYLVTNGKKFKRICTDSLGSRSMQKLLEHLKTPEQVALLISALRNLTHNLTKCSGGQFLLARCFCLFSEEFNKHLLNEVVENCVDIATDKVGCCTLYKCIDYAGGEVKQRLVGKLAANALFLANHPYGNFVVQHILDLRIPHVLADLVARLEGNFLALSMDKFGSHVVEKCMREFGGEHSTRIIQELISSPNLFLNFLQDKFGNYVAQTALTVSKGAIHQILVGRIEYYSKFLESHPCGKMVLARARGSNRHR